jgi:hypothetical protein
MNRKQRICLWVGIAIFLLMGLFPPWYRGEPVHSYKYGFLLAPPEFDPRGFTRYRLDVHRLYVQWIMVAVVTGGLISKYQRRDDR